MPMEPRTWLHAELPGLVADGTLQESTADRLRLRYPLPTKEASRTVMFTVFASVGVSLILLGVIVLMAFNWAAIPRALRVGIAFLPLVLSYALVLYTFLRRSDRAAWREASTLAAALGFAACAALLFQIYQRTLSVTELLLLAAAVSAPIIYILRSNAGTLLYFAALTAWAISTQMDGGEVLLYWPLFAAMLPRLLLSLREDRFSGTAVYLGWLVPLSLIAGLGVGLEKVMPGLWIIAYSCLFSALCLFAALWYENTHPRPDNPFGTAGLFGIYIVSFMLTYRWPWREIGWEWWKRGAEGAALAAGVADIVVTLILVATFLGPLVLALAKRKRGALAESLLTVLNIGCFLLVADTGGRNSTPILLAIHLVLNAGLLAAGVWHVVRGYLARSLGEINLGALILCVLICLRFIFVEGFFEHMIVRGLTFIGLGILFLAGNLFLARNLSKEALK